MNVRVWLVIGFMAAAVGAAGVSPIDVYEFDSAEQEHRYRSLVAELRCPKCLNTNLADSDAPIARDLRATVVRLLREGHTDGEILDYLQARYGDFVLYDPPFRPGTYLLWLLPAALLLAGIVLIARVVRSSRPAELTPEERARVDALLREEAGADPSTAPGSGEAVGR